MQDKERFVTGVLPGILHNNSFRLTIYSFHSNLLYNHYLCSHLTTNIPFNFVFLLLLPTAILSLYLGAHNYHLRLRAVMKLERRSPLILLFLCVAIGLFMAVYLYNIDKLALLYSSSSGLQQIGTVWLPLPHIMLLPFALVDVLMKTGFAGTAVSLPSIAISAAILYKIIKAQTMIPWIAFLGASLYFSNPNILYLGLTAMTEALFMLFFVISAFYFQKFSSSYPLPSPGHGQVAFSSNNQFDLTSVVKLRTIILTPLLKCSFFVALAALCRYEAWPIPIFLILFGFSHIAKRKAIDWKEALTIPIARMHPMISIVLCTLLA